jgi:2-dehydro-3-deoxyphosphogluconate aldolase/(4S)-4-hydroxy-2-oxoglutarate aldolase
MRLRLARELAQALDHRHETTMNKLNTLYQCIEIALTTPVGLGVVSELTKISEITVGAGTVLDADTATTAIRIGASFLLSPSVVPGMIQVCSRYGAVPVLGAFTPTEDLTALEVGADIVKIFSASTGGLSHIESISAPSPQASLMPQRRGVCGRRRALVC